MQIMREKFLNALSEVEEGSEPSWCLLSLFEGEDLKELIDWATKERLINGLGHTTGKRIIFESSSIRLTIDGKEYLHRLKNKRLKDQEQKGVKVEIVGWDKLLKALTTKNEILNEIRFLEADKVAVMKEKLEKLRAEEKDSGIPWEAMITLFQTITSLK